MSEKIGDILPKKESLGTTILKAQLLSERERAYDLSSEISHNEVAIRELVERVKRLEAERTNTLERVLSLEKDLRFLRVAESEGYSYSIGANE